MKYDLVGKKFGRLTVLSKEPSESRKARWLCRCDCGNEKILGTNRLTSGKTRSCGCLRNEVARKRRQKDLTGQRFGRLTVIERQGGYRWLCKCDCGNTATPLTNALLSGKTKSCGCYMKDRISETSRTHGQTKTKLYKVWSEMKRRCNNPNDNVFVHYGGRGITYAREWERFEPFMEWARANGYHEARRGNCTLDRMDVDGDYTPDNCRWITQEEQMRNTRRSRRYTFRESTHTLGEWGEITGINSETLRARIERDGWSVEKALTTPVKKTGRWANKTT